MSFEEVDNIRREYEKKYNQKGIKIKRLEAYKEE